MDPIVWTDCAGRFAPAWAAVWFGVAGLAGTPAAQAQGAVPAKPALFQKYVGSPDTDGFLNEPAVRAGLQKALGAQLPKLLHNLNVKGDVDLKSGMLFVSGNAPHGGGEEEGVVCVDPQATLVEAAIASKGRISVFSKAEKYEYVTLCIKDWITQINSKHRDRFEQPRNVQMQRTK